METAQIIEKLPFLASASQSFRDTFLSKSMLVSLPAGQTISLEQNQCVHLPIVLSGTARVYKSSDEGKELTLYLIESGQSCILTASCILNESDFPANAVAISDMQALVVPSTEVMNWMDNFPEWRRYICGLIAQRLSNVIELVQEVAFHQMDTRLASYLLEASAHSADIKKTHESIATDLGTSREVISRLLKELEHRGVLALSRGNIRILSPEQLQ